MVFLEQITDCIKSIQDETSKNYLWEKYKDLLLYGSEIQTLNQLTDFQFGFLSLLEKNWDALIVPSINKNVIEEFDSWYEEEGSYNEILVHSFDLRNLEQGDWEITFEDDNEDLIVHMYMKGWDCDYTARTG